MYVPSSSRNGKEIPDATHGAAAPKRIKRDPSDTTKPLRVRRFGGKHGLSDNLTDMHCSFNRIPSLISLVNLRLGFQLSRITPLWALALFQKWSTTIPRDFFFFFLLSLYIIYYGCLSANEVLGLGHLTAVKLPAKNISQDPPIPTHSYSWGLSSKSSYYWSITLTFLFFF